MFHLMDNAGFYPSAVCSQNEGSVSVGSGFRVWGEGYWLSISLALVVNWSVGVVDHKAFSRCIVWSGLKLAAVRRHACTLR